MIVFPHVPKTGGTSFYKALRRSLGDRLCQRSLTFAPTRSVSGVQREMESIRLFLTQQKLRKSFDVIYGHFSADLFRYVNAPVGMFFREPVARVVSEYHYKRAKGRLSDTSLEDFSNSEAQMRLYASYLGRMPIEGLAFVGLTERYAESLQLFHRIFGLKLTEHSERIGAYEKLETTAIMQPENADIYREACRHFEKLCSKHGVSLS